MPELFLLLALVAVDPDHSPSPDLPKIISIDHTPEFRVVEKKVYPVVRKPQPQRRWFSLPRRR